MSYKQTVKELSRELIWKNTIDTLTTNRKSNFILNDEYIRNLWNYVYDDVLIKFGLTKDKDDSYLEDWLDYANQIYNPEKDAKRLKVAYLCGPEPENDLIHLINLGIRIENIYAFESDNKTYDAALKSIKDNYPTLKIFNGKIDNFVKTNSIRFDIIYLDFTTPLFSRSSKIYQSLITLFENQALDNFSCLILNTTYPDKTDENIDFLTNYFHYQSFYEYTVFDSSQDDKKGRFVEDNNAYGLYDKSEFRPYIEKNFKEAYSAFQTSFITHYTNHILPISNVIKNPISFKAVFQNDKELFKKLIEEFENSEDIIIEASSYSLYHFFRETIATDSPLMTDWKNYILKNDYNRYSLDDAVKFFYILLDAVYKKEFIEILSDSLKKSIPEIMASIPDSKLGRNCFCDVPMIHLWLELAINQLGYPYHQNTKNHKRYSYQAKEREMCLDIFTFDQCRALYDWLPMIEYYGDDLKVSERQMMTRICIDAIAKHSLHILSNQFFGAALICIDEKEWSRNHYFDERINLGNYS